MSRDIISSRVNVVVAARVCLMRLGSVVRVVIAALRVRDGTPETAVRDCRARFAVLSRAVVPRTLEVVVRARTVVVAREGVFDCAGRRVEVFVRSRDGVVSVAVGRRLVGRVLV